MGGQAAINKLGPFISQIASRMGLKVSDVVHQFLTDRTLLVDQRNQVLYVDPPAPIGAVDGRTTPAATVVPTAEAFSLHSFPGAQRVIYLDFDGHMLSDTAWNEGAGGDCFAEPFDTDDSPTTFSDAERGTIIGIWARVAEDYRPFGIDVTTQDPGVDAIRRTSSTDQSYGARALITRSTTPCPSGKTLYASVCPNGCGGVAYVGVYDFASSTMADYYQPALVFQNGVGANEKYVAEATAHEVGHNLGLQHDGTSSTGYYDGHAGWAPIMGVGYYRAVTQWSAGEYANATNRQDDMAVMQARGAPLRADDHGASAAVATELPLGGSAIGIIGTRGDVDAFSVSVPDAGDLTLVASPHDRGPDLDISLVVQNATGSAVAVSNPAVAVVDGDSVTGLTASVTVRVDPGVYTVLLDGVGDGDPLSSGWSDYASLGQYSLATSFVAAPPPPTTTTSSTTTTTLPETTTTSSTTTTTTTTSTTTTSVPSNHIDVWSASVSGSRVSATKISATATVVVKGSAAGNPPISGASVSGRWTVNGNVVANRTGTTDSTGTVHLSISKVNASRGAVVEFCVTSVSRSGFVSSTSLFAAPSCARWTAA